MTLKLDNPFAALKGKLLLMAGHAEGAVNGSLKALIRRDDDLARTTKEDDTVIDRLEMDIDEAAIGLLAGEQDERNIRQITTAMKIAHDLERIGDEATTISRQCMELCREPRLTQMETIPPMGALALDLLKESLDAFVERDPGRARAVIPRDKELDAMNRQLQAELTSCMASQAEAIDRCLSLRVIAKSLERIGDHAKNVAEMVVYLCEGQDIRHRFRDREFPEGKAVAAEAD